MASMGNLVITNKGRELIAKLVEGTAVVNFTKICTSSYDYSQINLEELVQLEEIQQTTLVSSVARTDSTTVRIEGGITNTEIYEGYYIRCVGLYASSQNSEEEILYAVSISDIPDYMPPFSGKTASGVVFKLFATVSNSSQVSLEVDPSAFSTIADLQQITDIIESHTKSTIMSEQGVHGIRFFEGKLECFDGLDWVQVAGEGSSYVTYGVKIDTTNSDPETAVTYIDDAVNMTGGSSEWDTKFPFNQIRPCMLKDGVVQYYLDPTNYTKKVDGTAADITSGNDGDVMIEIPKMAYMINTEGNSIFVKITDNPNIKSVDNRFSYYAHTRDDEGDREKLYIGAYLGWYDGSSKLRSLSGKIPTHSQTIATFREQAQANGIGYDQLSFYPLTLLQVLYLIYYKNLDSYNKLGKGYSNYPYGSTPGETGGTNIKGMHFGESTGNEQMKFIGIEDFCGNLASFVDGLFFNSNRHILTAFKSFNDTGNEYIDRGQGATKDIDGFMTIPQGTTEKGFIVKEGGGSKSTFYTDHCTLKALSVSIFGYSFYYGGNGNDGAFTIKTLGLFPSWSNNAGSRLIYL